VEPRLQQNTPNSQPLRQDYLMIFRFNAKHTFGVFLCSTYLFHHLFQNHFVSRCKTFTSTTSTSISTPCPSLPLPDRSYRRSEPQDAGSWRDLRRAEQARADHGLFQSKNGRTWPIRLHEFGAFARKWYNVGVLSSVHSIFYFLYDSLAWARITNPGKALN